ncbi:MAG: 4-alpha-glucanotransferase [Treponemataceae bacterium]|nr:4-alpha-glucanotransferase [Treponemataceae bacterium]
MNLQRSSGILLHPTSLPETAGIGTIGKQAYRFVDFLVEAKQSLWQILPIGPTGYGDSPYASFSTFAGNPLIIDLDMLVQEGWLSADDIQCPEWISTSGPIDFGSVVYWKMPLLKKAARTFMDEVSAEERQQYEVFKKEEKLWLSDYATFMSIKEFYDAKAQEEDRFGAMWSNYWPHDLAVHDAAAVKAWNKAHRKDAELWCIIQYFFFTQWRSLKAYANEHGVSIIGDIPIFVAPDSADVWSNQNLFQLDENGRATAVAGVPPDYFSATGQLWGNPLYDWDAMEKAGYKWWINRIAHLIKLVDYVRVDHFRGFEAYWRVPAGEETAINGAWIPGPAHKLFKAIKKSLGDIPIIAEDLGVITEGVEALRDDFALPGMKVLQFAFDANEAGKGGFTNPFLPHMYGTHCVCYTGTHDNDTLAGWIHNASEAERDVVRRYVSGGINTKDVKDEDLCPLLIRAAMASTAAFTVVPLQDIFGIGSEGRMNMPSTSGTNWQWRMSADMFSSEKAKWLRELSIIYGRNL